MTKFSTKLNGISLHLCIRMFYKCNSSRCDLCLTKKLKIMRENPELLLNKQSELESRCRHDNKFFLGRKFFFIK